jgi:hypothetical protein
MQPYPAGTLTLECLRPSLSMTMKYLHPQDGGTVRQRFVYEQIIV